MIGAVFYAVMGLAYSRRIPPVQPLYFYKGQEPLVPRNTTMKKRRHSGERRRPNTLTS